MKSDADADTNEEKLGRKENPPWRDERMDDFNAAFHQSEHSRFKNKSSVLLTTQRVGGWLRGACELVREKKAP